MTTNTKETIQKALKMMHGLRRGEEVDTTSDEGAKRLVLKSIRSELLGELAAFQDVDFLAFIHLSCLNLTEGVSVEQLTSKIKERAKAITPGEADSMLSFVKLCQVRLSGYTGGVRL